MNYRKNILRYVVWKTHQNSMKQIDKLIVSNKLTNDDLQNIWEAEALKFHPKHEKRQNLRQSETLYENITH